MTRSISRSYDKYLLTVHWYSLPPPVLPDTTTVLVLQPCCVVAHYGAMSGAESWHVCVYLVVLCRVCVW